VKGANDYLVMHAQRQPLAPVAVDLESGRTWTYQAFDDAAARYARHLQSSGVGPGGRVAVLAKNRAELILLHIACARIGALYVPLNWRLPAQELAPLIADAEPQVLLGDQSLADTGLTGLSLDAFAEAARRTEPLRPQRLDENTHSLILYTSGTSGRPKGVLLSERNLWQTALNFSILGNVTAASTVLCDTPMFHIIGLVTNVRPVLMQGGRFLVSGGFLPERTLSRLGDPSLGVTHYFCVPQMAATLRASPSFDADKLRGLIAVFSGGGPHSADAIRRWTRGNIPMADGFGMSEAGTVSCMPLDLALIDAHAGSAGLVPPGIEIRIVDDAGVDTAGGAVGEILVRGLSVTSGYWRRPEETRSAFTADGWLRSGDLGRMDGDGYLWLIDRKKDMFISGGENVYPAEIEHALAGHASVAECAVIAMADERWGEVGHLVVVAAAGTQIDPGELIAHLEPRLARYKIPKKISIVDKLPRNGAGKVLKGVLRRLFTDS
jgi:fatty-acyl-CoA synthase